MKKVLFATTALIATAGMAAADVTFSGDSRFGLKHTGEVAGTAGSAGYAAAKSANDTAQAAVASYLDDDPTPTAAELAALQETANLTAAQVAAETAPVAAVDADTVITSRFTLNIDASVETNGGQKYGVRTRVRSDDGSTAAINAPRFYLNMGDISVGVGNIYGAIDSMPGLYAGSVGLTGLGWGNVASHFGALGYSSAGAGSAGTKEVEITFSAGDFGAHLATDGDVTEAVVSTSMGGMKAALGVSDTETAGNTETIFTLGGNVGGASVGLAWADSVAGDTSVTVSASFDMGSGTTLTAYAADNEAEADSNSFGIGVAHSLGGGATLKGGVVDLNGRTMADLGVNFSF